MWRARYWAVLGFQALLVLVMLSSALGLIQVDGARYKSERPRCSRARACSSISWSRRWRGSRCPSARRASRGAPARLGLRPIGSGRVELDARPVRRDRDRIRSSTSARSAPPSSVRTPPWSSATTARAGGVSTTRAFPRRQSSTARPCSTRRATAPPARVKVDEPVRSSSGQAPRQGPQDAHRRRGDAVRQEQGRLHRGDGAR